MKDLWNETIDPKTGRSSLEVHEVRVVSIGCKKGEHYFEFKGGSLREAHCKHCPTVAKFILGYHQIKDGKITPIKR